MANATKLQNDELLTTIAQQITDMIDEETHQALSIELTIPAWFKNTPGVAFAVRVAPTSATGQRHNRPTRMWVHIGQVTEDFLSMEVQYAQKTTWVTHLEVVCHGAQDLNRMLMGLTL